MKRALIAPTILGIALGAAGPALAHHSFAMFDQKKVLTLEGTVSQFQWTNPHAFIDLAVPDGASTGGTKRYVNARGDLAIGPLAESDSHNCDPRIGICLDWTDTGPVTGTLRHVHRHD